MTIEKVRLRQWRWKELPTYNGFVHPERVRGWQLINLLVDVGQIDKPHQCAISGTTEGLGFHSECYYSWEPYVLCQPVHMALHRRFQKPDEWRRVVDQYAVSGDEWFATLSLTPVDLAGDLRRLHGEGVADIFARAPIPADVIIPDDQVFVSAACRLL
jgi:hypothetical protein